MYYSLNGSQASRLPDYFTQNSKIKTTYFIFPKTPGVLCCKWYLMSEVQRITLMINVTKNVYSILE